MGETPLPIPNRAVKPHSADGTWLARAWESRSPPVSSHEPPTGGSSSLTGSGATSAHSGRPRRDGPRGDEARRSGESAWPCGAPVLPDRAPSVLGPLERRAMKRRPADLRARADGAATALGWLTRDPPVMRVGGGGGGRPRSVCRGRPGSRPRSLCGGEGCLAQRRELECRSQGTTHQLAKRAGRRPACRQRGEHVFVKVGGASDGTDVPRARRSARFGSTPRKTRIESATALASALGGAPAMRA